MADNCRCPARGNKLSIEPLCLRGLRSVGLGWLACDRACVTRTARVARRLFERTGVLFHCTRKALQHAVFDGIIPAFDSPLKRVGVRRTVAFNHEPTQAEERS